MQLFVVHPNLEVSDCDSSPTAETINVKKQSYLHNLKKYRKLIQRLSSDPSVKEIPDWCLTRDTESNISEVLLNNSAAFTFDSEEQQQTEEATSVTSDEADDAHEESQHRRSSSACFAQRLEAINRVEDLPIETIQITSENQLPFKETNGDRKPDGSRVYYLLPQLNLPENAPLTPRYKDFLALKYFQLTTDLSLVEFKYIQIYSKINKIIKKYFSTPELTPEIEDEGFSKVNIEMELFRKLENVLVRLRRLKTEFEDKFGGQFQRQSAKAQVANATSSTGKQAATTAS
ncbi:DEKNAAC101889 [Brettanomyces naardenensis]|uniref:DEKNAAC101889 n=1 Tax=Brettanomyces naardenensis TaxID=13370 RepID=A0A448YJ02_BRENA|nr:DEKNAAC101889 [Brettanomyces naardenensis]